VTLRFPTMAMPRQRGTYTALGYRSARVAAYEGRGGASAASGAAHQAYDRESLINQSREFMRDNGIYSGMINRAVSYIVGNGFGLQVRTRSKAYNQAFEAGWNQWWARPEYRGIISGPDVEEMVCRELMVCGDHGLLKINDGTVQLIEAEQIKGPKAGDDGIEKDEAGRPKKYYVGGYNRQGRVNAAKAKAYRPDDFLFVTRPDRPSSIRSTPPCQATFPMLHRINDVCDSEAVAWQMLARLAISVTRQGGPEQGYLGSIADDTKTTSDTSGDMAARMTELDYALIFHANPGEEVKGIERNIPGRNFSESLLMFLRLLGLPLGLPLEIILLDWTKSNYSQSRAVLEQAFQTFLRWQMKLDQFVLTPLVAWKKRLWEQSGLLAERKDFAFEWIKPTFPWLDQLKESQAYGEKLDRGMVTHSRVCKSLNTEREDVIDGREAEVRDAIDRAKKIKEQTGVEVPWQIFAGMKAPTGAAENAAAGKAQDKSEEKSDADTADDDTE